MVKPYNEQIKSPKWQKVRLRILERDNWECTMCGDTETQLQVHHKYYSKIGFHNDIVIQMYDNLERNEI